VVQKASYTLHANSIAQCILPVSEGWRWPEIHQIPA